MGRPFKVKYLNQLECLTNKIDSMDGDKNLHLKEKYEALKYSYEQFDKNILLIASGALGISFSFIEKLVDLKTATYKGFLISSWTIFGIVIFLSLLVHFISIRAIAWAIEHESDSDDFRKGNTRRNWWIRSGNISMMVLLLIGMTLLISFVKTNI